MKYRDPKLLLRVERLKRTKVQIDEETGCWIWQGATQNGGYGTVSIGRSNTTAHRMFYAVLVEQIPKGETVHHKCATRLCVNPEHLESITQRENMAEMFERKALNARIHDAEEMMIEMLDSVSDAHGQDAARHDHEDGEQK